MGYTHYWYRPKKLNRRKFVKVVSDFKKMVEVLDHLGIPLADGDGEGKPVITDTLIRFNGVRNCGHAKRDLGITWPAKDAHGVAGQSRSESEIAGDWFAGAMLNTRICDGDCSHESFVLEQDFETVMQRIDGSTYVIEPSKNGLYFDFCKTAYKPYDLAVNIVLIIAKHYFGNDIIIHSDGEAKDWRDAMELCQHFLGYGMDFALDNDDDQ